MVRGRWAILYAEVSVLVASGERNTGGMEDLAQSGARFGEKGNGGLCPDIRDSSPHLIPQVSSYTAEWQRRKALFKEERTGAVAGNSKGTRKQADLSERCRRRSFLTTREIRFLRDINRGKWMRMRT